MLSTALFVLTTQDFHGEISIDVSGTELKSYALLQGNRKYKPLLIVFHGTDRNAQEYAEHAFNLAHQTRKDVIAPLFDKERFPNWRYHRGGIQDEKGNLRPRFEWTYALLEKWMIELQNPDRTLIGHSAGGQFLNRMCAFAGTSAKRVVVANPGSVIFPRSDWNFPFGMGGLSPSLSSDEAIKDYLAQPMTFLLGTADNKPDDYFDTSKEAMRQGGGRLQRSTNCFNFGKALAKQKRWQFGWRLVLVPGIGHDHQKMFDSPEAITAINAT